MGLSEWLRALLRREFERDRKAQGASRGEGQCGVKLSAYAGRAGLIAARSGPIPDPAPDGLHLVPDPEPLMTADPDRPGAAAEAPGWRTLWRGVRTLAPSLVIVDPASAALADANQNDGATVRRFIRALAREAERGGWGVLLVAHSTKAARYGGDPGPGAIAGSGQWWDACRGVLHMRGNGPGRACR